MNQLLIERKKFLQRIDDTFVNLLNEGRNVFKIRNKILEQLHNNDIIIITTNFSEVLELRDKIPKVGALKPSLSWYTGKEDIERYNRSWFWVVLDNEIKSGTSGSNALEHTMDIYPKLPVIKLKYKTY